MGGRELSRDGDGAVLQVRKRNPRFGDEEGPTAPSERTTGAKQSIAFTQMSNGVVRYLGKVQLAFERHLIKRLHVFEPFPELDTGDPHFPVDERIENKRIVRAGRIAN